LAGSVCASSVRTKSNCKWFANVFEKQGAPLALAGVVSEVTQAQIVVPVE